MRGARRGVRAARSATLRRTQVPAAAPGGSVKSLIVVSNVKFGKPSKVEGGADAAVGSLVLLMRVNNYWCQLDFYPRLNPAFGLSISMLLNLPVGRNHARRVSWLSLEQRC